MTTTALDRIQSSNGTPGRLGQATAVEQSRAVAQVQAQVIVAQQMPRDITRAVAAMQRSCAQKSLADKAFYSFRRGGENVTGPSVQLARELARCFGNMEHGVAELRRDDEFGQSEMLAFAWDLETNTRSTSTFIVPHRRDRSEAKGGSITLTDQRDIYENNANNGARRLREMIFAVLPGWFTEDAITACYEALAADNTDGATHAERTERCVARFADIGVKLAQLEQRVGAPAARWSAYDLAQLGITYRSIERNEVGKDEVFPGATAAVTAADILTPAPQAEPPHHGGPAATQAQVGKIQGEFKRLEFTDAEREARLAATAKLAGLPGLDSTSSLRRTEAHAVIERLIACADRGALIALLANGDKPDA